MRSIMQFINTIMAIIAAVSAYAKQVDWQAVMAAIDKAVVDYNGQNYAQVVGDLITALQKLVPQANLQPFKP